MSLLVRDLSFAYGGGPPVLRGVTLEVPAGTSAFLLGPSGCGKSTLLRCVAGLAGGYGGEVRVGGARIDELPPHRRRVGMLFQEPALFPHLPAWANVAFGMRYAEGAPPADERKEAERWLDVVGLAHRARAKVDALSGGERQRVALVRTLAARPRAVLLDEPMSALDRDLRDDLGPRVKVILAEARVPALWVTHDREEAQRLGDAVFVLREGRAEPVDAPQGRIPKA